MGVLQNWYLFAFAAPVVGAVICLADSCVIGKKLYRSPMDGPVITGLFSAVPLVFWLWLERANYLDLPGISGVSTTGIITAALAAVAYLFHIYFYFRALFRLNDVANTEAIMALSVVFVPVLAWIILGEKLAGAIYLAAGLSSFGLLAAGWSTLRRIANDPKISAEKPPTKTSPSHKYKRLDVFISLLLTVLFVSVSMVLQAKALTVLSFSAVTIGFLTTTLLFSLIVLALRYGYRQRLIQTIRRYYPLFFCIEAMEASARLLGQRAIDIGPSVTAVALIQSTLPLMIIVLSLAVLAGNKLQEFLSPVLRETLTLQSQCINTKTTLFAATLAAALVLQNSGALEITQ